MSRPIAVAAQAHDWDNSPHSTEDIINNYCMEIFPKGLTLVPSRERRSIVLPRGEDISPDTHVMVHCLLGLIGAEPKKCCVVLR